MRENLRIGSVIMIIAGLILAYVSVNRGKARGTLETTGIEVPGKVVNAHVVTKVGRRSGSKNWLAVEYTPKGQETITQELAVTTGYLASISKGDEITATSVPVVYSASDPKNAIIRNGSPSEGGSGATKIMLLISALGGVGFWLSFLFRGKP